MLWFAPMVLRQRSIDIPIGAVEVNGFVIDMATVFEDFVTAALSDALERIDGKVRPQDRHWFDTAGQVKIYPDLVWYRGGKPVAVIDAKYKAEKPAGYPMPTSTNCWHIAPCSACLPATWTMPRAMSRPARLWCGATEPRFTPMRWTWERSPRPCWPRSAS